MAVTGQYLRLALACLLLATLVSGCSDTPEGEKVEIFAMALGQCYNDTTAANADAETVFDIRLIDCDRPHSYEVYHIHRIPDEKFPGSPVVSDMADDICEAHFADYVGTTYDNSIYLYSFYTPNSEGWRTMNDRDIVCIVESEEGATLIGSVRGSGR